MIFLKALVASAFFGLALSQNLTGTSKVSVAGVQTHNGSLVAPKGAGILTVGVLGDYGWTGWVPAPDHFCGEVMAKLQAAGITIPNELVNDCDPGDKSYILNATALQMDTAQYIGQICTMKKCSAFISVGDNFYDSGVDFTTGGILRFEEAWVNMYNQGVFEYAPWYQCIGNHDVVRGQSGVDFETTIAPIYDKRWYFGSANGDQYYTYDLEGADWTATFVVVDSDCFLSSYQKNTSVYKNSYTTNCYNNKQVQIDFLNTMFKNSNATWKFLQLHHPYMSAATNETDLEPLIEIVVQHKGIVLNGHDHCLGYFFNNDTNYILTGAAGFPQAGDCNNGTAPGPYAKYLAANSLQAANGFVTLDISKEWIQVEYYARDMQFENGDLYPVQYDLNPSYSFVITQHSI